MEIIKKIQQKLDINGGKPVTIAFLGDSVTQGCFECYLTSETSLNTVFEYKSAYSTRLRELLNILYPEVQINIINSGISGDCSDNGLKRIERDILNFNPDLVVVSYGLNDACCITLEKYKNSLSKIFETFSQKGIEFIFLTENEMCRKVSCHLDNKLFIQLAQKFSALQNSEQLAEYFNAGKEICLQYGGKVCDIYRVWQKMHEGGVDTTELLANKFNHPRREFHYYIAIKLLETMFEV